MEPEYFDRNEYTLGETILQVKDVNLSFGDSVILKNVNAEIKNVLRPGAITGQIIAFVGPSGSGKTCLSKIIAGLIKPTSGEILMDHPLTPVEPGQAGYVEQHYFIRPDLTVLQNLMLACRMDRKSKARPEGVSGISHWLQGWGNYFKNKEEDTAKCLEYLKKLNILSQKNKYPAELSGGQKQRVAIAQQMLCSSYFLIMDEPFSGLDPVAKDTVCELIVDIANLDEFNTVIIVSHDIVSALRVADTVWLLGRESDEEGNKIPGSRIMREICLMDMGLAWRSDKVDTPEFDALVHEIEDAFKIL